MSVPADLAAYKLRLLPPDRTMVRRVRSGLTVPDAGPVVACVDRQSAGPMPRTAEAKPRDASVREGERPASGRAAGSRPWTRTPAAGAGLRRDLRAAAGGPGELAAPRRGRPRLRWPGAARAGQGASDQRTHRGRLGRMRPGRRGRPAAVPARPPADGAGGACTRPGGGAMRVLPRPHLRLLRDRRGRSLGPRPRALTPGLSRIAALSAVADPFGPARRLNETLGPKISTAAVYRTAEALGAVAEAEMEVAVAAAPPAPPWRRTPCCFALTAPQATRTAIGARPSSASWSPSAPSAAPLPSPVAPCWSGARSPSAPWSEPSRTSSRAQDGAAPPSRPRSSRPPQRRDDRRLGSGSTWTASIGRAWNASTSSTTSLPASTSGTWPTACKATPRAQAFLTAALRNEGPGPLLAALHALRPKCPADRDAVRKTLDYREPHAAAGHMDYPAFAARDLPIASGPRRGLLQLRGLPAYQGARPALAPPCCPVGPGPTLPLPLVYPLVRLLRSVPASAALPLLRTEGHAA